MQGSDDSKPKARPLEPVPSTGEARLDGLARLTSVIDRLRAPDGCPWDLEQTIESMVPSLIEEAHEAAQAIESGADDAIVEELGDVLMVLTLMAKIAQQRERFDLGTIGTRAAEKLVRRHPHVFGALELSSSADVLHNWERIKRQEREKRKGEGQDQSALAGIPSSLPALQRANSLSKKSNASGFRWACAEDALAKVEEELAEVRAAFEAAGGGNGGDPRTGSQAQRAHLEEELGDLLIAGAFLGQYVGIDPERAARKALRKFEQRFRHMETSLGKDVASADLATWMAAWQLAKKATRESEQQG